MHDLGHDHDNARILFVIKKVECNILSLWSCMAAFELVLSQGGKSSHMMRWQAVLALLYNLAGNRLGVQRRQD